MLQHRIRKLKNWLRAKWRMFVFRLRKPPMPPAIDGQRLVHIGCGEVYSPEFINVDARAMPHIHYVTDNIFDLKMFPNGSVNLVYMCHILEHVKRFDRERVLAEMFRVLAPGGVLRIAVPDFDRLVAIYEEHGRDMNVIEPALMGGQTYAENFHFSAFTQPLLTQLLHQAGFREVRVWDPATAPHHRFDDWANRPMLVAGKAHFFSLNLEGVK